MYTAKKKRGPIKKIISKESFSTALPILFLLALIIGFSVGSPVMLNPQNITNILRQSAVLLIVSCGATFIVLQGSIDLSVGSIVTLTGIAGAILIRDYQLGIWALPAAMLGGGAVGALNGFLFAYGKVPSFLVTLGALFALDGLALLLSDGQAVQLMDRSYARVASGSLIGTLPNIALSSFIVFIVTSMIGKYTKFGRYMYAIGGGERVARLSGIPVDRFKLYAFIFSGILCGLAGALMMARLQAGSPRMGEGLVLDSIAAVVISGTALPGGVGGVHRTILGVFIIGILSNGLNVNAVDANTQIILKGVIMVAAVFLTIDRTKINNLK